MLDDPERRLRILKLCLADFRSPAIPSKIGSQNRHGASFELVKILREGGASLSWVLTGSREGLRGRPIADDEVQYRALSRVRTNLNIIFI